MDEYNIKKEKKSVWNILYLCLLTENTRFGLERENSRGNKSQELSSLNCIED